MYPSDLKYSKTHQWVRVEGNMATIGVTYYAQEQMGELVYVELPEANNEVEKADSFGTIESVKAVVDVFSPVSGRIVEVNEELPDAPETVNQDPYGAGWMIVVEMSAPKELDDLMDSEEYQQFIEEESGQG